MELTLDLRGRLLNDPGGKGLIALARGPLVLAFDCRVCPDIAATALKVQPTEDSRVQLVPNPSAAEKLGSWLAFDVTFTAADGAKQILTLCDFASAGNTWDARSLYRVWLPQPLNLVTAWNDMPTWLMHTWVSPRPQIPPLKK